MHINCIIDNYAYIYIHNIVIDMHKLSSEMDTNKMYAYLLCIILLPISFIGKVTELKLKWLAIDIGYRLCICI